MFVFFTFLNWPCLAMIPILVIPNIHDQKKRVSVTSLRTHDIGLPIIYAVIDFVSDLWDQTLLIWNSNLRRTLSRKWLWSFRQIPIFMRITYLSVLDSIMLSYMSFLWVFMEIDYTRMTKGHYYEWNALPMWSNWDIA